MIRVAVASRRMHLARRAPVAGLVCALMTVGGALSATADPERVPTTTRLTCDSPQTYTGQPLTPCAATVTATDGMTWVVPVIYSKNVNAGTATASAGLTDTATYQGSYSIRTFTIDKAPTSTALHCPDTVAYTGTEVTPCSATLLMGGTSSDLDVRYRDNVGPGKAYADAVFPGDANHAQSGESRAFLIGSPTSVTVTCAAGQTYTGGALTPCTATATAADRFSAVVPVTYSDNTDAGTATATASYAGDATHLGATGASTFTIAKAAVQLGVTCSPAVYTGAALTPCLTFVGTVGTPSAKISTVYTDNTDVGTGKVTVSYPGDANHLAASSSATFTITPAPVDVTLTCPPTVGFTGVALSPCTATATGPGGLATTVPVTYTDNTYPGTATATATYPGDANHLAGSAHTTFTVLGFTLEGYAPPVRTLPTATYWNVARAGSTVPLKFDAYAPDGTEITSTTTLGATLTTTRVACTNTPRTFSNTGPASSGQATIGYDPASGQFVQSWKTDKGVSGCFRVTTTAADHSQLTAHFILV